jgi:hypothetical protein
MYCLRSLGGRDRGFESHTRRGCLVCVFFCVCIVLCLGRGLATSWSPVQGILPSVIDQETEKSVLRSKVGARTREKRKKGSTPNWNTPFLSWILLTVFWNVTPCSVGHNNLRNFILPYSMSLVLISLNSRRKIHCFETTKRIQTHSGISFTSVFYRCQYLHYTASNGRMTDE